MDTNKLHDQLINDEGLRLVPYEDSVGKLTIGVGRNIVDVGISKTEAMFLLDNDIKNVCFDLDKNLSFWRDMSDERQLALANMCFNLGISKLITFKKTINHLQLEEYEKAADEMMDSIWAKQVGSRAYRLSEMIRNG